MSYATDGVVTSTVSQVCKIDNKTQVEKAEDLQKYSTVAQNSVFNGTTTVSIKRKYGEKVGKCGAFNVTDEKILVKEGMSVTATNKTTSKDVTTKHNTTFDFSVSAPKSGSIMRMGMMFILAFIAVYFC